MLRIDMKIEVDMKQDDPSYCACVNEALEQLLVKHCFGCATYHSKSKKWHFSVTQDKIFVTIEASYYHNLALL